MHFSRISPFFSLILFSVLLSCKNKNVTEDVQRYCDCLSEFQHNPEGREKCLEMMGEIKIKYQGDNRALMQVLEETDNCL